MLIMSSKTDAPPRTVFAYGTLKTGQCRHSFWPCTPIRIEKAWTLGELYDLGDYPALLFGNDRVAGELRWFSAEQMDQILRVLDEVEEYRPGQEANNLYNRGVVQCTDALGEHCSAYAYVYVQPAFARTQKRIEPIYLLGGRRFAVWPEGSDW